jgi:integrase
LTVPRATLIIEPPGGVAERFKAAVLKTVGVKAPVGSNPTSSVARKRSVALRAPSYSGHSATHLRPTLHYPSQPDHIPAISQAHQATGQESPTTALAVPAMLQGIRRAKGAAQAGKAPTMTSDIRRMVETLPDGLLGVCDRALLLVGLAGAFRRSEPVGLDAEDIQVTYEGLVVALRRSKTDQEGAGRKVGIRYSSNPATCPVRALMAWLEASAITSGRLIRSVNRHGWLQVSRPMDKTVALVMKRRAEAVGLEATRYAGHSLRAGLETSAEAAGVSERANMAHTGHRRVNLVQRYIREGSLFLENAAASMEL